MPSILRRLLLNLSETSWTGSARSNVIRHFAGRAGQHPTLSWSPTATTCSLGRLTANVVWWLRRGQAVGQLPAQHYRSSFARPPLRKTTGTPPAPTGRPAHWWFDDATLWANGLALPMRLALPGSVNRGNAAQAVVPQSPSAPIRLWPSPPSRSAGRRTLPDRSYRRAPSRILQPQ